MVDYSYATNFQTAGEAQPVLNEAALDLARTTLAVNMGTVVVDGDSLVFVDHDNDNSKIAVAATLDELQSGRWHMEFPTRALASALAVLVARVARELAANPEGRKEPG